MQTLRLARLGQTMEQGTIQSWLKAVGDEIVPGEVIYEVETEKTTVDVEATAPGTLARIVVAEGDDARVGDLLAIVADPGEQLTEEEIAAAVGSTAVAANGAAATVTAAAPATVVPAERVRIMPRARALAARAGLDISALAGSGPGGAITVADVERAGAATGDRRPLAGRARAMADVMTRSRDIPQFFQQVTVRAAAKRRAEPPGVTFTDVLLHACAHAVADCPHANASFAGDAIIVHADVNLGVAVDTPNGLVVPVLRGAQALTLGELATERARIVAKAREDRLTPDDVSGATLTVSNLGMAGIEGGAALITPPQSAIVFTGAITDQPVVIDGTVAIAPLFQLSVTYDHRVLDGATAAAFTLGIKHRLEETP